MTGGVAGLDFGFDKEQERYRQHVRLLLADEPVRAAVAAAHADLGAEPDVRPLYRELGCRGLLAPHWPIEYGGGGRDLFDLAIVYEELVRAGVPDQLHVNTIQIVGQFVLMAGTPEQRAAYLPGMAAGEIFGSVFY
ncbi:MAG: acyl-CoA dehydrogenase family protein, partial [Micromonosporaceae bacterium]